MLSRLPLRITFLSAIACVLSFSAFAQQRPGDDVVRVNTELIQTDVMVFDKQGAFVDGLKRDQFVLKVDGKPRDILFFDRIIAGSHNEESQLAAARGVTSSARNGGPVPLDRGRTVMFFLDDLHLSAPSINYVREMLKRFVEREMGQNDEAAIATASGQLGFLQQISSNKAVITAATERLRYHQSMSSLAGDPPMTEYQALLIQQHDSDVLGFFVDALM